MMDLAHVELLRREREGPLLVLLHGAGACAEVFRPLLAHLDAFDVIAPSLPGRGASRGPAVERADEAAAWLSEVLDALGGPPPLVLGHSYGGAVALSLALARPLAGLVLVGTGARLKVHPLVLALAESNVGAGLPWSLRAAFTARAAPETVDAYEAACAAVPPATTLADWRACDAFDVRERLGEIACPALVIGGSADALTPPRYSELLGERLPRASCAVVEGAGHMQLFEEPARLAAQLRSWAAGTGGA